MSQGLRPHTASLLNDGRRPECFEVEDASLGLLLLGATALLWMAIGAVAAARFALGR
jgi:hypothetical protein